MRKKLKHCTFRMPTKSNLKSRISTINNAFAISITPYLKPEGSELSEYYRELDIKKGQCGYCMRYNEAKTADHINPLVISGMPSGYITDINNLIPCCKDCNSKKQGKLFKDWYLTTDNVIWLKTNGMDESTIMNRYKTINKYISKHCSEPYSYKDIVGEKLWNEYCMRIENLKQILIENQLFCEKLNNKITDYVMNQRKNNNISKEK